MAIAVAIVLLAAMLRWWQLPEIPPGFYYDEAYNAMDGVTMRDSLTPQAYFVGNTGRHALMPYLLAVSTAALGNTPYACRIVNAMLAPLTVALTYRWLVAMLSRDKNRRLVASLGAAGMAVSFWYVVMTRTAYEAPLVPLFVVLTSCIFWQAWRSDDRAVHRRVRRVSLYIAAGIAVGASQYAYVSARLLPVVFGLFGGLWSAISMRLASRRDAVATSGLCDLWRGMVVMAVAFGIAILPLVFFIWQHPHSYLFRSSDVFILRRVERGEASLVEQLGRAVRLFVDESSPTWRHNIPGESGFDWLSRIGFFVGLGRVVWQIRRAGHLYLLTALGVFWLPAALSEGMSTLRMAGMLPIYYAIAALGWVTALRWLVGFRCSLLPEHRATPLVVAGAFVIVIAGGWTSAVNYFTRWAGSPEVYESYDGPKADLARFVAQETHSRDVLLPFSVYANPTVRFLLYTDFREVGALPELRDNHRGAQLVQTDAANVASLVWLGRDLAGQGFAYVTRPQDPSDVVRHVAGQMAQALYGENATKPIALVTPIDAFQPWYSRLTDWTALASADYQFDNDLILFGYEVSPVLTEPGRPVRLALFWRTRTVQPLPYHNFIQLLNGQGDAVAQWTEQDLADEHRWRLGGVVPDIHTLWLSPEATSGPYLVRMGLFDPGTGRRASIFAADGAALGDQLTLGLFYVSKSGRDPRLPDELVEASLAGVIDLVGYSLSPDRDGQLNVQIHWRARRRPDADYTAFVQLLNADGERVAGWDSQPRAGLYPTSRWQPGEIVVDQFAVPLPTSLESGRYQVIAGMYLAETGQRLAAYAADGTLLPDNVVTLVYRQVN